MFPRDEHRTLTCPCYRCAGTTHKRKPLPRPEAECPGGPGREAIKAKGGRTCKRALIPPPPQPYPTHHWQPRLQHLELIIAIDLCEDQKGC